jgi:hypothetical protein
MHSHLIGERSRPLFESSITYLPLLKQMNPTLEYIHHGRSGYVLYKDAMGELRFYYEIGGGQCMALINIPRARDWTAATGRSPGERNSVLNFIAKQSARDQAPGGYARISDQWIEIFGEESA